MSTASPAHAVRRGRPKGTGRDDRATLAAIGRLIATSPSLAPTTAIKALGITDPSAIRRLRDKHRRLALQRLALRSPTG